MAPHCETNPQHITVYYSVILLFTHTSLGYTKMLSSNGRPIYLGSPRRRKVYFEQIVSIMFAKRRRWRFSRICHRMSPQEAKKVSDDCFSMFFHVRLDGLQDLLPPLSDSAVSRCTALRQSMGDGGCIWSNHRPNHGKRSSKMDCF